MKKHAFFLLELCAPVMRESRSLTFSTTHERSARDRQQRNPSTSKKTGNGGGVLASQKRCSNHRAGSRHQQIHRSSYCQKPNRQTTFRNISTSQRIVFFRGIHDSVRRRCSTVLEISSSSKRRCSCRAAQSENACRSFGMRFYLGQFWPISHPVSRAQNLPGYGPP